MITLFAPLSCPFSSHFHVPLTFLLEALEALRNALYKCSTYLLTYLLLSLCVVGEPPGTNIAPDPSKESSEQRYEPPVVVWGEVTAVIEATVQIISSFLFVKYTSSD